MISDAGLNEPGLQSRLKRKQDFIDFLEMDHSEEEDDEEEGDDDDDDETVSSGIEIDDDEEDNNVDSSPSSLSPLESKTVKELRLMIFDAGLNEPGLQSRLKRKQDFIDFLEMDHSEEEDDEEEGDEYNDGDYSDLGAEMKPGDSATSGIVIDEDDNVDVVNVKNDNLHEVAGKQEEKKKSKKKKKKVTDKDAPVLDIPEAIVSIIPVPLQKRMDNRGLTSLLPSQAMSFARIQEGRDTVLQAPTGSGKTLAYVIPLLSRTFRRPRPQKVARPVIITLAPSRELARQVGKEWSKFTDLPVVTVFGGVPIERHVNLLKHKPFILVSTPGRLRELVRTEYVDYSEVMTLVLDEADTLLDKGDSPDVYSIFNEIETAVGYRVNDEYQLVLVSATINKNVREFTEDLEISPRAYIRVEGSDSKVLVSPTASSSIDIDHRVQNGGGDGFNVPTVQHWHMACKSTIRPSITADLISILSPRLTIIFVPTKSETESVASYLGNQLLMGDIRILHGDMSQTSRSRSITLIRETAATGVSQILVATDVASRGLDLPNVDLVIQYAIPREAGKEGTFSTELYTHRTGRTGRVRMEGDGHDNANAILLYDPAVGEAKILPDLVADVQKELKVSILPKPIPSVQEVVEAGYRRSRGALGLGAAGSNENNNNNNKSELVQYFTSRLEQEEGLDTKDPQQLVECLAEAMAALSNLNSSLSPFYPQYSLLTRSPGDRTLRLSRQDGTPLLGPPEVTKYCKELGSGKLGRVSISDDGSALFDLTEKRAKRLLEAVAAHDSEEYELEMPSSLS
jgi:superfamily II DNA/RNA helicase